MNEIDPDVEALALQARVADLNMSHVLKVAEITPSTWHRWRKSGMLPQAARLRRLATAINAAIEAKRV